MDALSDLIEGMKSVLEAVLLFFPIRPSGLFNDRRGTEMRIRNRLGDCDEISRPRHLKTVPLILANVRRRMKLRKGKKKMKEYQILSNKRPCSEPTKL